MNTTQYEYPAEYINLPEDRKAILKHWIKENLKPRKAINQTYSSYGLCDLLERDINAYFSNDEFKGAMLELGYKVKDLSTTNWYFGITKRSIDTLWRRIFL